MRLEKVLPSAINPSQACVPGRNISKNVQQTLQNVNKYANLENISAAILFIDQEKAFDRISPSFSIKEPLKNSILDLLLYPGYKLIQQI